MQPPSETEPSSQAELQRLAAAVMTARTQRQMSRAALAEQAGVALQIVADLERGYPVARKAAGAICRNLDLPEPRLDGSPLIRLALLVRQRRGQARLSRSQLAGKSGLTTQVIRSVEMATLRPSQQICMALLSVQALQLREFDVAEFLTLPVEETPSGPPRQAETPPSNHAATARPSERASSSHAIPSRPATPRSERLSRAARDPLRNHVVATFRIRFHADGSVSIQMRPHRSPSPQ